MCLCVSHISPLIRMLDVSPSGWHPQAPSTKLLSFSHCIWAYWYWCCCRIIILYLRPFSCTPHSILYTDESLLCVVCMKRAGILYNICSLSFSWIIVYCIVYSAPMACLNTYSHRTFGALFNPNWVLNFFSIISTETELNSSCELIS